jgi:hypothetical protein
MVNSRRGRRRGRRSGAARGGGMRSYRRRAAGPPGAVTAFAAVRNGLRGFDRLLAGAAHRRRSVRDLTAGTASVHATCWRGDYEAAAGLLPSLLDDAQALADTTAGKDRQRRCIRSPPATRGVEVGQQDRRRRARLADPRPCGHGRQPRLCARVVRRIDLSGGLRAAGLPGKLIRRSRR